MELTDEQKQRVAAWIEEGLKLSDIQQRLGSEYEIRLTYMDVRFLVDDLKLMPRDPVVLAEPTPPAAALPGDSGLPDAGTPRDAAVEAELLPPADPFARAGLGGGVKVKVDEITRPGAMVSGAVTFSDGKKAGWYLDQMGRLGMVPEEQGYRPPQADVAEFQIALEQELTRMGI
jgi:hypothetical protein